MTTPTQREQDKILLEEIASHESSLFSWGGEDLSMPGSPKQNHIARLYESGYIETRFPRPFHNPRFQSIGGASHYVLTKSGQEYLEMLSGSPQAGQERLETPLPTIPSNLRVFISHGKNRAYIQYAEETCKMAGFDTEVSIFEPNTNQRVSEKVASGISRSDVVLVFLTDDDGHGNPSLNAAGELQHAVFQDKHVILFREHNVNIPSNVGGLAYNVLEGQWTLKLMKELAAIRNR